MVNVEEFYKLYRILGSSYKQVKVFEGNHSDNRPYDLQMEIIEFIISCFKKPKQFSQNIKPISPRCKQNFIFFIVFFFIFRFDKQEYKINFQYLQIMTSLQNQCNDFEVNLKIPK